MTESLSAVLKILDELSLPCFTIKPNKMISQSNATAEPILFDLSDDTPRQINSIKQKSLRKSLLNIANSFSGDDAFEKKFKAPIDSEDDSQMFYWLVSKANSKSLITVIGFNISEQQEIEQYARSLSDLSRYNPNPIFEIDSHQDITIANPAGTAFIEGIAHISGQKFSDAMRGWSDLKQIAAECNQKVTREISVDDRVYEFNVYPNSERHCSIVIGYDLTELRKAQNILTDISLHDDLTGAYNRRYLDKVLESSLSAYVRKNRSFAIALIDIDYFKKVNDSFGHEYGDFVIAQVSNRLNRKLRAEDIICRFGGDEFVLIFFDVQDTTDLEAIGHKVASVFREPFEFEGKRLTLTCTTGIAKVDKGDDKKAIMKKADIALYHGKSLNRNNYQVYCHSIADNISDYSLMTELEKACDEGEFFLTFQPQHQTMGHGVTTFEALVRWQHPTRGELSPGFFLEEAERFGLMGRIDDCVIEAALTWLQNFNNTHSSDIKISINISSAKIQKSGFASQFLSVIKSYGLSPKQIEIELLESIYLGNKSYVRENLTLLSQQDVSIALDDFGTGYSSLSYLHAFPIHKIKLAQELVINMLQFPQQTEIIKAAIAMAKALKVTVVAEGVENKATLDKLSELGVDLIQGYYFSKPIAADKVTDYLGQSHSVA